MTSRLGEGLLTSKKSWMRIPGAQEQMGDAAILFDPTNHVLWSDAVARVMQDK